MEEQWEREEMMREEDGETVEEEKDGEREREREREEGERKMREERY